MNTLYCAGGMSNDWEEEVRAKVDGWEVISPSDPDLRMDAQEYTSWDLHHIRQADAVLCYIERDNPSGIGAAIEVGYGVACDKTVVAVIESNLKHFKDRYFDFMREAANVQACSLEKAADYLNTFQ